MNRIMVESFTIINTDPSVYLSRLISANFISNSNTSSCQYPQTSEVFGKKLLLFQKNSYHSISVIINLRKVHQASMQFSPSFENGWDEDYDPFGNPPELQRAMRHYRANLVGVNASLTTEDLCQCCYKVVSKKELDMRCHQTQLSFLGSGIILYFEIAKITVFLLIILMLFPIGIQAFLIYDSSQSQIETILLKFDLLEYSTIPITTLVVSVIIILLLLIKKYYDRQVYITQKSCLSPSYYAIKMSNLPNYDEEELKNWIGHQVGEIPIAVHTAVDVRQMEDAFKKRQELTIEMHRNRLMDNHRPKIAYSLTFTDPISIDKRQRQILTEIGRQDDILNQYANCFKIVPYKQTGVAFAVFEKPQRVKEFITKYQGQECSFQKIIFEKDYFFLKFKDRQVKVSRAPAPKDIIWNNLTPSPYLSVFLLRMITFLGKCAIVIGSIIFLRGISQEFPPTPIDDYRVKLIVVVLAVYSLSYILLHLLIQIEQRMSKEQTYTSKEVTKFQNLSFFSIILIFLIPYWIDWSNQEQIIMVYCLILIDTGLYFVNRLCSFKNIYRKVLADNIIRLTPERNPYTQDYLNRLMEGDSFELARNYYFAYRSLLFPVYFAHIAPMAFLISVTALIIEYWMQRYLLLRKCKIPHKYSRLIADSFMHSLALVPVVYVLGVYQFVHFRGQTQESWRLLVLLISTAILSLSLFIFFRRTDVIFQVQKSFLEVEHDFSEFYELQNPIKKYNGEQKYKSKILAKRQMINSSRKLDETSFDDFFMREKDDQETKCEMPRQTRVKLIHRVLSYNLEMLAMNESGQYKRLV